MGEKHDWERHLLAPPFTQLCLPFGSWKTREQKALRKDGLGVRDQKGQQNTPTKLLQHVGTAEAASSSCSKVLMKFFETVFKLWFLSQTPRSEAANPVPKPQGAASAPLTPTQCSGRGSNPTGCSPALSLYEFILQIPFPAPDPLQGLCKSSRGGPKAPLARTGLRSPRCHPCPREGRPHLWVLPAQAVRASPQGQS